jgi:hypothetical protein
MLYLNPENNAKRGSDTFMFVETHWYDNQKLEKNRPIKSNNVGIGHATAIY